MQKFFYSLAAMSLHNGIIIYSSRNKGAFSKATLAEDGTIIVNYYKSPEKSSPDPPCFHIFLITFFITIVIGFILLCYNNILEYFLLIFPFACFISLISYILIVRKTAYGQSIFRFHSAEHMVLNAFEKLQKVPSLEEAKKFSRFSSSCGTNYIISKIIDFSLLCLGIIFFKQHIFLLIQAKNFYVFQIYVIRRLLGILWKLSFVCLLKEILFMCGILNFLQYLTTMPPTDKELDVSIACLQSLFNNEYLNS